MPLNAPVVGLAAIQSQSGAAGGASGAATLEEPASEDLPQIAREPTDQAAVPGGSATFTALPLQPTDTLAQWQVSTDGGAQFQDIPGATSPTLTLSPITTVEQSDRYRVVLTNGAGSDTSASAELVVGGEAGNCASCS